MKELLNYIVSHIVFHPEDIQIKIEETESGFVSFYLEVNPNDMGIIIGKGGHTIRAIRNLLRLKAIKEGKRANLELVESTNSPGSTQTEPESDTS